MAAHRHARQRRNDPDLPDRPGRLCGVARARQGKAKIHSDWEAVNFTIVKVRDYITA